jgi:Transposase
VQKPIRSFVAAVTPEELFIMALAPGQQRRVVECRLKGEPKRAQVKSDWSAVQRIAVDETSARRGQHNVTNLRDAENTSLLLVVKGRSAETRGAFDKALVEHGGDPSQIEPNRYGYESSLCQGCTAYFPQARIVFEKFQPRRMLANGALDQGAARFKVREPIIKMRGGACAVTPGGWDDEETV